MANGGAEYGVDEQFLSRAATVRARRQPTRCRDVYRDDLRQTVALARARGVSWEQIGQVLHLDAPEAVRRFGGPRWRSAFAALTLHRLAS
jgi:hypothetical protein